MGRAKYMDFFIEVILKYFYSIELLNSRLEILYLREPQNRFFFIQSKYVKGLLISQIISLYTT